MSNQIFIKRVITSLLIAPLIIILCLYAPPFVFISVLMLVLALSFYEWRQFLNCPSQIDLIIFFFAILVSFSSILLYRYYSLWFFNYFSFAAVFSSFSILLWLFSTLLLYFFSQKQLVKLSNSLTSLFALMNLSLLAISWLIMLTTNNTTRELFIYLLLLIWIGDSSAYFVGKTYGKTKLAPLISPGKSFEGFWSETIVTTVFSALWYIVFYGVNKMMAVWLLFSLIVVWFSVLGDLFISMLKRMVSLKDTGAILPGHGGVLDRIDSLLSASPIFLTLLWLSGWL